MTNPTPLTAPHCPLPILCRPSLTNTTAISESPYSGTPKIYKWPRTKWMSELRFQAMTTATAAPWYAMLFKLEGRYGRFWYGMPGFGLRVSGANPTLTAEATAGSQSVSVTSEAGQEFKAGSIIQIGTRLHSIVDDATGDGTATTLNIRPAIFTTSASGAVVILDDPKGLWRLQQDKVAAEVRFERANDLNVLALEEDLRPL